MVVNQNILFIGCGKMGSAIIHNLLKTGFEYPQFTILKPSKTNQIVGIKYISSYQQLPKNYHPDIVFFAFKPQSAKEILLDFATHQITNSKTIFISILAGKNTNFFTKILGEKAKMIRIMPNLPTLINQGVFGYYYNYNIKKSEILGLQKLFNAIGKNIKISDENLINAVTAISGSGPAYLFLFIKNMIKAAVKLGLNAKDAEILVEQTIFGASKMAIESDEDLEDLIKSVSSKGGTTEAALNVLEKNDQFTQIIFDAIKEANKKAEELSK